MSTKPIDRPSVVRYLIAVVVGGLVLVADARLGICSATAAVAEGTGEIAPREPAALQQLGPAAPSPPPGSHQGPRTYRWYGYQLILSDLGSIAIGVAYAGIFQGSPLVGVVPLLFAPPAIHMAHGRADLAARSVLMRLGFTVAGAFVGWAAGSDDEGLARLGGIAIGAGLGLATAVIVDYSRAFAPRPGTPETGGDRPATKPHGSLGGLSTADVALAHGGAIVRLGGTF